MTKVYNQLKQDQTNYACSVYAFLNVIKYDYGIELKLDWILKLVIYLEKIGALLTWGASANIIYPVLVKYVQYKTGFKLRIVKGTIKTLDTKKAWILGFKKANKSYVSVSKDSELSIQDIDIIKHSKGGYGHFHCYKRDIILESLGGYPYKVKKDTLKYALKNDLYYNSTRAFVPNDDRTRKAQKELIVLAKKNGFISYGDFIKMDFNS